VYGSSGAKGKDILFTGASEVRAEQGGRKKFYLSLRLFVILTTPQGVRPGGLMKGIYPATEAQEVTKQNIE